MESTAGTCGWCGTPLEGRSDKQYCSASHRRQARRKRKRDRERSNSLSPATQSDLQVATREADERFRAMLAADTQRRVPQLLEAEWSAWERRHPGTAHPGRIASRIQQGLRARAEDWSQGTARFQRPVGSIAELARASRGRQRHAERVLNSGQDWDDSDPDMMEAPTMIDMGNWRRGRKW